MKFENTRVMNFKNAIRGARNPKNSWNRSDSYFALIDIASVEMDYRVAEEWARQARPQFYEKDGEEDQYEDARLELEDEYNKWLLDNGVLAIEENVAEVAYIGPKDMKLLQNLIYSGPEHRKFMRQIFVSVDITAPLYWWKEFDTYKVGTVANSTSTMHTITTTPITQECFEMDDYEDYNCFLPGFLGEDGLSADDCENFLNEYINFLEGLRLKYLETKDKRFWKELIRWLPESWLQTRTVTMNYENLLSMCGRGQRRFHKLTEWSDSFISWARTLPYAQELIFLDKVVTLHSN